jgi:hypothetical protein
MNTNYLKDFVPHEPSLALKELGFDEPCFMQYDKSGLVDMIGKFRNSYFNFDDQIAAPLYQQAFRWLYQKLEINGVMPLDEESQIILLKELIDRLSSKCSLV